MQQNELTSCIFFGIIILESEKEILRNESKSN